MPIALQDLKSTFSLDTNPLKAGAKIALAGVGALVAGIGIAAKATMDWAADLDSLGDIADGTGEGLAAMAFIARKSGIGVEVLTKSTTMLNKSLLKSDGTLDKVGKALKDYGIDVKDANGNVKDSVQLTDEISKKYAELSTQQERVNFLTDIYGKNGAQMVDFFDTLAADGGIDKVAQKVRDLGLAIDPARYEQFNRNLEELKLMGLGLAVSFTEKLMPALEKFTGWIMTTAIPSFLDFKKGLEKAFKSGGLAGVATFLSNKLKGVGDAIRTWFSNLKIDELLAQALDFAENIDWQQVGTSITEGFAKVDWFSVGKTIGDFVMKALEILGKIGEILWTMLDGAIKGIDWGTMLLTISNAIINFIEGLAGVSKGQFIAMLQSWGVSIAQGLANIINKFMTWRNNVINTIMEWKENLLSLSSMTMGQLLTLLENKLREIGKKFFTRAAGWVQQAIQGFLGQLPELLSVVSGLVSAINAELKRIITSFRISVSLGGTAGTTGTADLGSGSSGGSVGGGGGHQGKSALATPVSAVSSATQNQSGEVTLSTRTIDALADKLGSIIPTATVKAMNNA